MLLMLNNIIIKKTGTEALETIRAPKYACCSLLKLANLPSRNSNIRLIFIPSELFVEALVLFNFLFFFVILIILKLKQINY